MDREVCFISGAGNLGEGQRPISTPTDNQCGRSPSRLRREGLLEDGTVGAETVVFKWVLLAVLSAVSLQLQAQFVSVTLGPVLGVLGSLCHN